MAPGLRSGAIVRKVRNPVGRPRWEFDYEELLELYKRFRNVRDIAKYMGVSHSTVHRRLREAGIELRKLTWCDPEWVKENG
ncbi:MAG: helix-turn-helix domain-containing protein [Moorellaceae bacterium]